MSLEVSEATGYIPLIQNEMWIFVPQPTVEKLPSVSGFLGLKGILMALFPGLRLVWSLKDSINLLVLTLLKHFAQSSSWLLSGLS